LVIYTVAIEIFQPPFQIMFIGEMYILLAVCS